MALTDQQQNFLSQVEAKSGQALELMAELTNIELQWFENQHNTGITDQELGVEPQPFPHISASELTGAITGLLAIRDAINTYKGNFVRLKR
jgi:hypothetical protein